MTDEVFERLEKLHEEHDHWARIYGITHDHTAYVNMMAYANAYQTLALSEGIA